MFGILFVWIGLLRKAGTLTSLPHISNKRNKIKRLIMNLIDLTGRKFGRLTVVKRSENVKSGYVMSVAWFCICDCGNKTIVR